MNISRAISSLISQLGLYNVNLPFKDKTESVIQNVLFTTTIPTYSQFVPWVKEETINLAHQRIVNKQQNIYLLPESLTTTPIMSVLDVYLPIEVNRGMFGDVGTPFGVARSLQGVLVHQAYSMVVGQARSEPTFEYLGENKIRLFGFPKTWLTIKVSCEHDENGESIPPTCYDSFMQLATLDTKIFLYNNLKMYDNIATAFGNISLKSEDNQGAEAERNALLEEWRNTFHLDITPWNWM